MKRNIVILNGSPRRKGNTAALVAAFTQGAEAAGHQVTTFFLEELDPRCETLLEGMRLYGPSRLRSGDVISMGPARFLFRF